MYLFSIITLVGLIYMGLMVLNGFGKSEEIEEAPKEITYRNLYIGQGSNTYVYGLNKYRSQAEAKKNQQCPPGYRWHSAIPSRRWA